MVSRLSLAIVCVALAFCHGHLPSLRRTKETSLNLRISVLSSLLRSKRAACDTNLLRDACERQWARMVQDGDRVVASNPANHVREPRVQVLISTFCRSANTAILCLVNNIDLNCPDHREDILKQLRASSLGDAQRLAVVNPDCQTLVDTYNS